MSRDPTILGIRSNISSKLFELVTPNLVSTFVLELLFDCRVLLAIVYCEAVRSAILATAWLLVYVSILSVKCFHLCLVNSQCASC